MYPDRLVSDFHQNDSDLNIWYGGLSGLYLGQILKVSVIGQIPGLASHQMTFCLMLLFD